MSKLDKIHRRLESDKNMRALEARYDRQVIPQTVTILKAFFLLALKEEGWGFIKAKRILDRVAQFEKDAAEGLFTIDDAVEQVELEYKKIKLVYREGDGYTDHIIYKE